MLFHRILVSGTGRTFLQDSPGQDVNTQYGVVRGSLIDAAADGGAVTSERGERLIVMSPTFIDRYKRIKRDAQIITFKDAGVMITTAGLGPESIVAEAGSGSGALTVLLARHCKHVFSYDLNEEHLAIAKKNVDDLGLKNVTFSHHDIAKGMDATDIDCLILDMPEPWTAFALVPGALKVGGYVITYVPSVMQLKRVHEAADGIGLMHVRSVEVSERHWMVRDEAVRPTSKNVGFTAFLSFFRWLGPDWKALRPVRKTRNAPQLPDEDVMRSAF